MSRKQVHKKQQKNIDEGKVTLKDLLDVELMKQLQEKKQEMKTVEEEKKRREEEKKSAERKRREKNKSFEELLDESNLDWTKFK
ncbi:YqkE family protein [Bacillus kwashiorkori]|uniref:YqkE family protein n=1 Tax=Bacillus kwashiorkori TaxID=1522318 RepID=UPI0007837035|nr:YqkE family protein [Bacillus kwashiorkori]